MLLTTELPYQPDTARSFAPLAEEPWALLLDSAWPGSQAGRYDIIVAMPSVTMVTIGESTRVEYPDGRVQWSEADPFVLLRHVLRAAITPTAAPAELPFCGGAIGYFGYDLARRFMRLPRLAADRESLPEMAVGIYDGALVVDHARQTSRLVAQDSPRGRTWLQAMRRRLAQLETVPAASAFRLAGALRCNLSRAAYRQAFDKVKAYIRAGDCYQANLAMRFAAHCTGHPWPVYAELRRRNPAPYSAWLNFPFGQVMSSSPECFLTLRAGQVATRPIKGTRPRAAGVEVDAAGRRELACSEKDRAENLMIVDLLRNDLGKVCRPGSVTVPELFKVVSFATVHHLVSTVTGQLAAGKDAVDLLAAAFPGGSITGAPKLRAMEIIDELEPQRRGVYCGAIGYLGFDGAMDLNIAIRTLVCAGGEIRFWAGGGLVADSQAEAEYQECHDKARALLDVLARFQAG